MDDVYSVGARLVLSGGCIFSRGEVGAYWMMYIQ